jgi:hypothetical protein
MFNAEMDTEESVSHNASTPNTSVSATRNGPEDGCTRQSSTGRDKVGEKNDEVEENQTMAKVDSRTLNSDPNKSARDQESSSKSLSEQLIKSLQKFNPLSSLAQLQPKPSTDDEERFKTANEADNEDEQSIVQRFEGNNKASNCKKRRNKQRSEDKWQLQHQKRKVNTKTTDVNLYMLAVAVSEHQLSNKVTYLGPLLMPKLSQILSGRLESDNSPLLKILTCFVNFSTYNRHFKSWCSVTSWTSFEATLWANYGR